MDKTGNVIFITGGTSGIGLALAKEFWSNHNIVIVCGRDENKLAKIKADCPGINVINCDITRHEQARLAYHYIKQKFPGLNVLINNAAIQNNYDFLADSNAWEKAKAELETNLLAPIHLTKLFSDLLVANKRPLVVNILSPLGIIPKQKFPTYCASKAGLYAFSRSLNCSRENKDSPSGYNPLKIVAVMPPLVNTGMATSNSRRKMRADVFARKLIVQLMKGKTEIFIGKSRLLPLLRAFPNFAMNLLNRKKA